ncbi:hypothetical protein [Thiorhodospira sibirica]|uniref:hypothetical protein n=1 Tax=Thiorhodospira sibirica TaxID=154347 RepID=UPI00022C4068|nr:hypothetical protein [Thiorhodospira sibirica]
MPKHHHLIPLAVFLGVLAMPLHSTAQQWPELNPGLRATQASNDRANVLQDAFGRFSIQIPSGVVPMGSTYNMVIADEKIHISVITASQDEMFNMNLENFPEMVRQMGAEMEAQDTFEVRKGLSARYFAASIRDPQSERRMRSVHVFIPGPNIWLQATGPDADTRTLSAHVQKFLDGLRF